jgi:predicted N-formylglutamate amidohydrolase
MATADNAAYEILHASGRPGLLLVCDHASNRVPAELDGLGLDPALLERHIGWDIGAGPLARRLADLFDAPAVLSRFSRLVIDPNRALDHPQSIPPVSDDIPVPGNQGLDAAARAHRVARYFDVYHGAIEERIEAALEACVPAILSVHTFTPIMNGIERPWHAAVLHDDELRLAVPVLEAFRRYPDLLIGDNVPYTGYSDLTYTVPYHASRRGLPNVVIEVRQDLVDTPQGVERWAYLLSDVLAGPLADDRHRQIAAS